MNTDLQSYVPFLRHGLSVIDLLLVYFIVYRLLLWTKSTHVFNLVKGLFWVFLLYPLAHFLGLTTIYWLFGKLTTVLLLLVIIIFQPELRRYLERIGTTGGLFSPLLLPGEGQSATIIKNILRAIDLLAKEKVGALIVIEVSTNLTEYIESGIEVNGRISSDLLASLFWPASPTHDGAVIIRENKIAAAGCMLPLTDTPISDRRLGTRHRAALGLSELSDSVIVIVSEETGIISLAENGKVTRYLTKEALETRLFSLYKEEPEPKSNFSIFKLMSKWRRV